MPTLILLSGPPGSGKTTFAAELASRLPCKHIESDAIRNNLYPQPTHSRAESNRVFTVAEKMATSALRGGVHALIDATNLRESFRSRFYAVAEAAEATVVAVRLVAPEDTIRARVRLPRDGHSTAGEEVYDQLRANEEPLTVAHLVVDTRYSLGAAIDLVCALAGAPRGGSS